MWWYKGMHDMHARYFVCSPPKRNTTQREEDIKRGESNGKERTHRPQPTSCSRRTPRNGTSSSSSGASRFRICRRKGRGRLVVGSVTVWLLIMIHPGQVDKGERERERKGDSPAVWTVFFRLWIIRLSPDACKRTLVRSSGLLGCRSGWGSGY